MNASISRTAWADLPNAALVDEVLALTTAWGATRDAAWGTTWDAAWVTAWNAAWDAAWDSVQRPARDAAWDAARVAARDATRDAARNAAWGAVQALIAWDDAAELYPLTPAQLRLTMQLLPDSDHRRHAATLLLPYAMAREITQ